VLLRGIEKWSPNLRFITLTGVGDFRKSFRRLKYFLRKSMGVFEYFGVRTGEGLGVIHFVYAGKSVRYGDLSRVWAGISGFWNVSISRVRNVQGMMREMLLQHKKIRYFHSRYWSERPQSKQSDLEGTLYDQVYRTKITNNNNLTDKRNKFYYLK
jgi:hypothetical protein